MPSVSDEKKFHHRLKTLSDAFLLSSRALDSKSILRTAAKYFKVFTEADASVLMLNNNDGILAPVCSIGIPFSKVKDIGLPSSSRLKDIIAHPILDLRYTSFMNTPLIQNRRLIGLSAVFSTMPEKFLAFECDRNESLLLTMLASHISVCIEHITLINTIDSIERSQFDWENTFDAIEDMISIHDTDFNIVRANTAVARRFNMDVRKIVGKKCYKIFHGTEEPWKTCPHRKSFETRTNCMEVIEDPHMGGIFEIKTFPHFDAGGKCMGSVHVVRDITKEMQRECLLKRSEEKYRLLVENLPDVVWTANRNGETTFISSNVKNIYGFTPEELYKGGESLWFGRMHNEDVERVKIAYELLFISGKKFDIEYRIMRKDGKWIWLHDRAMSVYEKDGIMYADGVFSDITERKDMWRQLIHSEKMATLGMMTSWIAHEINNPLSVVSGYTQSMLKEGDERYRRQLTKIHNNAVRMSDIVKRLLGFVRCEEIEKKPHDIHAILEDAISWFSDKAESLNIQLVREYDKSRLMVRCHGGQMQQVFVNMISNAFDAMKSSAGILRTLLLKTERRGDFAVVSFKDTGCGISRENMEKVFNSFFTTKPDGTGLGLSICRMITQDHGGNLLADSRVGEGTVFTIELPLDKTLDVN